MDSQEQQHRLPVILASDGHPLLDSADRHERSFLDTPGLRLDAFGDDNGNSQKSKGLSHVEAPDLLGDECTNRTQLSTTDSA